MKNISFVFLGVCFLTLTSCYTTQFSYETTYVGNIYKEALGKSKNEILRIYGVPDRSTDDGAGGEVLIYEKFTQTTTSSSNSSSYGGSNTYGGAVYGNNAAVGAVYNRNGQVSSGNARSQTTVNKAFLNLFIDKSGNVYDFKASESGDRYNTKTSQTKCYSKLLTWSGVVCSAIFPPFLIATVPIAIVTQRKAKKKGELCN